MKHAQKREASTSVSLFVLLICILAMAYFAIGLGTDIHIPLATASGILMIYGVFYLHIPFQELMTSIVENIASAIEVFLILLLIGATIGTWISSGTVPLIIYYGLKIFSPQIFLVSVILICSIMSVVTGSSWTTVGTIGIAFMGIGEGLGFNPAMTAGAIVCGAYFGDKQSPMSDSTNYAAAVSKTGLYDHVRSMLYTTGPAMIVSAIIFFVLGLNHSGTADLAVVEEILDGISGAYNMTPALVLPMVIMIVLILLKVPAVPTMMICAASGLVFTMLFQGATLAECCGYLHSGFVGNTGNAMIDKLLTRGGMSSMYYTIAVMLWSLCMAGLMSSTGVIGAVMKLAESITKKRPGLILTHLVSGWLLTAISADIYLSMILPAKAFGEKYDEMDLDRSVMSRTCEDGTTIVAPMIPWTTSGVYTATTLGLASSTYLPYYFLGWINPIFVIICVFTGFGMLKPKAVKKEEV